MSRKEIKDLESKIQALVLATVREAEAYDFYMNLSEEYDDKVSKDMFIFLAQQELGHKETLEKLLSEIE